MPDYRDDREAVIARALEAGVRAMVNVGYDLASSRRSVELADRYDYFFAAVGVHPHEAASFDEGTERELADLLSHPKVLAVGEIGLDYYRDLSPRDRQQEAFRRQLALAREKGKPVIVHCRDALQEVLALLGEEGGRYQGIFHAFSGSLEEGRRIVELGFHLGIGGVVTFRNSRLRETVADLPPGALVLETDSPYLTPHPFRGKRNEPAHLALVVREVAAAQGVTEEDVVRTTTFNFRRAMGLGEEVEPAVIYRIRNSIYVNLTNRCTNSCVFCSREEDPVVRGYYLGLQKEPTVEEILEQAGDVSGYDEVVFCGYGEPTLRLRELVEAARRFKERGAKVRLNTNGLGNLIWKRNIVPELAEVFDVVSVSLNTPDAEEYVKICRPAFGEKSFPSLLDFVRKCSQAGIETVCTAVAYPGVDIGACRELAESLGARFRERKYNVLG